MSLFNRRTLTRINRTQLGLTLLETRHAPATFTVDDAGDDTLGTNGAGTVGDLRYCIINANDPVNYPGADTIVFNSLFNNATTISLDGQLKAITASLTINGPTTATLVIEQSTTGRIFEITGGTVALSRLLLSNGNVENTDGGGIAISSSTVTLTDVAVNACTVSFNNTNDRRGGGIYISSGQLTINGGSITNNKVSGNSTGHGAGIYSAATSTTLNGVRVSGNSASTHGGGLYCASGDLAIAQSANGLTMSKLINNISYSGGAGLFADNVDNLTITRAQIVGNSSTSAYGGGGILVQNSDTLTITGTTVDSNYAYQGAGGIGLLTVVDAHIEDSTISNNTVDGIGTGGGAGLYVSATSLEMWQCTVSTNIAVDDGGGGLLITGSSTVQLDNCTVAANEDDGGDGGGGILNSSGTVTAESTIIADNTSGSSSVDFSGTLFNATNCLIENTTGISFTTDKNNQKGVDPALEALADNGGRTETHAIPPGSSSKTIDNGSNPHSFGYDQRDKAYVRTFGSSTDIGSFEQHPYQEVLTVKPTLTGMTFTQFSRVEGLLIVFSQDIADFKLTPSGFNNAPADAFLLEQTSPSSGTVSVASLTIVNQRSIRMAFTKTTTFVDGTGSLKDGAYKLTVYASEVTYLDGDMNGSIGADYVNTSLYRLFGDEDGDRDVDVSDFAEFKLVYGGASILFDIDGDGDADTTDYAAFRLRFGSSI